jgi:ABC-type transporter Mla subunit MlaD
MALQDLTPQLRTRLSRMERAVGVFVLMATLLLLIGFAYYLYNTAQRKGWFITHAPYFTFLRSASGLKVGDPVMLMGFNAGDITEITPMPPSEPEWNVYVTFRIRSPYFGYLWDDSKVKITSGDFLGNRFLEVTKGTNGHATYQVDNTDSGELRPDSIITAVFNDRSTNYIALNRSFEKFNTKNQKWEKASPYWLVAEESPALADRLESVISIVQKAMPGVLSLTNQVADTLSKSSTLLAKLNDTVSGAQPLVTNLAAISERLRDPHGSLGEWLIPTNINSQLQTTLVSANATIRAADTNLNSVSSNLNQTLFQLADITSNLNAQVQANSLMLTEISSLIVNADDLVQGLKRNWLLKSSFRPATNPPLQSIVKPSAGGAR